MDRSTVQVAPRSIATQPASVLTSFQNPILSELKNTTTPIDQGRFMIKESSFTILRENLSHIRITV